LHWKLCQHDKEPIESPFTSHICKRLPFLLFYYNLFASTPIKIWLSLCFFHFFFLFFLFFFFLFFFFFFFFFFFLTITKKKDTSSNKHKNMGIWDILHSQKEGTKYGEPEGRWRESQRFDACQKWNRWIDNACSTRRHGRLMTCVRRLRSHLQKWKM
jgi:hypothetical protein